MTSEKLSLAVQLIKSGNKPAAQTILKEILRADPDNEKAWLWLYACTEKVGQKQYFLQQALRIDPDNPNIQRELSKLGEQNHIIAQPIRQIRSSQSTEKYPKTRPRVAALPPNREVIIHGGLSDRLRMARRFLLGKSLRAITVLLGVALIMFLLMHAIPGNPWSNYSTEQRAMQGLTSNDTAARAQIRHFGLDLPLWRQFTRYFIGDFMDDGSFFCGALCGNLGPSIGQIGRSVQDILFGSPEKMTFWESRFGYSIAWFCLGH
jgi:hypothetical protein